MAKASYRYTQDRVNEIIDILSKEDQRILKAHMEDRYAEAAKGRPAFWGLAGTFFGAPVVMAIFGGFMWAVANTPDCPAQEECPVAECPDCPVIPEPAPLEWNRLQYHDMRFAHIPDSRTVCYWPEHEDVYFCLLADTAPETVPDVQPVE